MRLTCLAILGCVLAASPAVPGGKPGEERSKIAAYLKGHDVPVAAELGALSGTPAKPLMAIAEDAAADGLVRARAVAALRLYPSTATRSFLGKLIEAKAASSDATDQLLARRAAVALGWLAGAGACAHLAALFASPNPEVRIDAAIGLGLTRAPEAPAFLRKQLAVETVAHVRDQIERQLRALGQAPPAPEEAPRRPERPPMRSSF